MPDGSAQTVDPPYRQLVARADGLQSVVQPLTGPSGAGHLVLIDYMAIGGPQGVPLQVRILLGGADPNIADKAGFGGHGVRSGGSLMDRGQ